VKPPRARAATVAGPTGSRLADRRFSLSKVSSVDAKRGFLREIRHSRFFLKCTCHWFRYRYHWGMNGNDTNKETTMNATQKMILRDATKILKQLRKADQHAEADRLARRVADMIEAAA